MSVVLEVELMAARKQMRKLLADVNSGRQIRLCKFEKGEDEHYIAKQYVITEYDQARFGLMEQFRSIASSDIREYGAKRWEELFAYIDRSQNNKVFIRKGQRFAHVIMKDTP